MNKLKAKEQGFTLLELMVVMATVTLLTAISIPLFLSQRDQAREAGASYTACKNVKDQEATTKKLVKYVEQYNVNNPSHKLEDFEIIKGKYSSDSRQEIENDAQFSLIVDEVKCKAYRFDSINGGHFTIEMSKEPSNTSQSKEKIEWEKVYDSRQK